MSVLKPASGISLLCAAAAFLFAPTAYASEAGLRALTVFSGLFLWSSLALYLMSRLLPAGVSLFISPGPKREGTGAGTYVDLEKNAIDASKLQELLR